MPCCRGVGSARVISEVRLSCVGSLAPRRRLGRGSVCARAQEGSGEAELESEVMGSAETVLAPEAKGSGETELAPEPMSFRRSPYSFLQFLFP